MNGERWQQIGRLFHEALARQARDRAAFLAENCAGDDELRSEIEDLIASHELPEDFIERDACDLAAEMLAGGSTSVVEGQTVGPYKILELLGAGGMGQVFRATDTRLHRTVTIKILRGEKVSDPEHKRRFLQEARAASALNHPNIVTLYDIANDGEMDYLVMEYVEGKSLDKLITAKRLPLADSISYGAQIASALAAAHSAGIVHRDIKPANVIVTPESQVKVLDFGLAKLTEREKSGETVTAEGAIMGTPAYMSPEQASGRQVDHRTDTFSLGVMLYEMVAGTRPFTGKSHVDTMHEIVHAPAPPLATVPPRLADIVDKALAKDPKERYQNAGDLAVDLRRFLSKTDSQPLAAPSSAGAKSLEKDPRHRLRDLGDAGDLLDEAPTDRGLTSHTRLTWVLGVVAVLFLIALSVVSFFYFRRQAERESMLRYSIAAPEGASDIHSFAISPNGRTLVIAAMVNGKRQLWIRPMDSLQAAPMAFTEDATYPFWSPDSSAIGFFAQGRLKKIAAGGGPAESLCSVPDGRGGSWNRDGVIIFSSSLGGQASIQRIQASRGIPADITGAQSNYLNPVFLPDGQHFLVVGSRGEESGIYVSSLDGKQMQRILPDSSSVVYAAPSSRSGDRMGRLLFVRDNSLMAQPFDADSRKLLADAFPVAKGVSLTSNNTYAPITASETGVLLYESSVLVHHMYWFDRNGNIQGEIGSEGDDEPSISPDGKAVLFERGQPPALWLRDLNRGTDQILTQDGETSGSPKWSRSGDRLIYGMMKNGTYDIYQKFVRLSAPNELLVASAYSKAPTQVSNGVLVYQEFNPKTKRDIWVLRMEAAGKAQLFLQTPSDELFGQLSPNGRWMAYSSDVSGRREVWVRSFPTADRETQISTAGGQQPRWSSDGKELFFQAGDGKLTVVAVNTQGDTLTTGPPPQALFDMRMVQSKNGAQFEYDVSPDAKQFLIASRGAATPSPLLSVIVNWPGESSGR